MKGGYNKKINMNTKGKMAPLVTVLIVLAILVLVVGAFFVLKNAAFISPEPGAGGSPTDCNIAPSLSFSVFNELSKGTAVTAFRTATLNGVLQVPGVVPTSFQYGDEVQVLYNASDYIDVVGPKHSMTCGVNTIARGIYATDDATLRVFNTDGNRITDLVLDNCILAPGTNQSSSAASISLKTEIQSAPLQTTGDLVLIVEVANSTQVGYDGITVSGTGVTDGDKLSTYTQNVTASSVRAFNLPASVNGALTTYYVNLAPKTGITMGGNTVGVEVYFTLYSKQDYYDTDGSFKFGIENSQGTVKYEDTQRFGFCLV